MSGSTLQQLTPASELSGHELLYTSDGKSDLAVSMKQIADYVNSQKKPEPEREIGVVATALMGAAAIVNKPAKVTRRFWDIFK